MRRQLTPLAVSLCLLGMTSIPVFAATTSHNSTKAASAHTQSLEQQVADLRQQVSQLKKLVASQHAPSSSSLNSTHQSLHGAMASHVTGGEPVRETNPIEGPSNLPTTGVEYLPVDLDVPGQSFVSSGPYIGIPLEYSGGNLIINTPSVNQDVALLKIRKNIRERLVALGIKRNPNHAHVLLSGIVEGQAMYKDPFSGPNTSTIELTSAGIDAYILGPSKWLSSLISLVYDNTPGPLEGSLNNNARVQNSRFLVNQAFITFGDLQTTPLYGTIGQYYVPFGTYSSNMVSAPLTTVLGRTKARAILIGVQPQKENTLYGSGFIFRGDSYAASTARINNGGINLGYRFSHNDWSGDIGTGVIANIADSGGMQNNGFGQPNFGGFGGTNTTNSGYGDEQLVHRVAAYDFRALLSFTSHITLLGEYITSATAFSPADLQMNNHGAKPQALNAEAAYTFSLFSKPSSVAIGYGMSKQALAIGLPAKRFSVVLNTSWWKDTLQSLEFRHDIDYGKSNTANGSTAAGINEPVQGTGNSGNTVTAQFDVYF